MVKRFKVGDKVQHNEYGQGTVIDTDEGNCMPYRVQFKTRTYWCWRSDLEKMEDKHGNQE